MTTQTQSSEEKLTREEPYYYSRQSLEIFSPFKILDIAMIEKISKMGRNYTAYEITFVPLSNQNIKEYCQLLKGQMEVFRAIKDLAIGTESSIVGQCFKVTFNEKGRMVVTYFKIL